MARVRFELTDDEMRGFYWEGTQEKNEDGSPKYTHEELNQFKKEYWEDLARAKGFKLDTVQFPPRSSGFKVFTAETVEG